jgi:hypothetical protein
MQTKLVLTLSLFALLAGTLAYGQTQIVTAKIPFAFISNGKTLPAGEYRFIADSVAEAIQVQGTDKAAVGALVPILTRLGGGIHTSKEDAHIVFDQVGGVYTLSEVWAPNEDGWQLSTTKGKHQHRIVNAPVRS